MGLWIGVYGCSWAEDMVGVGSRVVSMKWEGGQEI